MERAYDEMFVIYCIQRYNCNHTEIVLSRRFWAAVNQILYAHRYHYYSEYLTFFFYKLNFIFMLTGAFLIPYLVMLVLAGKPMYFLELAVGQFSGVGPLALWNCCPIAKGKMNPIFIFSYTVLFYKFNGSLFEIVNLLTFFTDNFKILPNAEFMHRPFYIKSTNLRKELNFQDYLEHDNLRNYFNLYFC